MSGLVVKNLLLGLVFFFLGILFSSTSLSATDKASHKSKAPAKTQAVSAKKIVAPVPTKQTKSAASTKKAIQSFSPGSNATPLSSSVGGGSSMAGGSGLQSGVSDSQKSLEIRGQSRNLSMMLVLKNKRESIDFVKPRENYKSEIQNTNY